MNLKTQRILQSLREAIHEALAESPGIAAVMAELERSGHSPSFSVDVSLPEEKNLDDSGPEQPPGELLLTSSDEDFLRNMGIESLADASR